MVNHICLVIIISTLAIYVLLDGRALAMCVLVPFVSASKKTAVYQFILPSWDANQTWLVFSLAALYGAYSQLFSNFFSSQYLLLTSMLILFILRGASIEFSLKAKTIIQQKIWHICLALSSVTILVIQSVLIIKLLVQQQSLVYLPIHSGLLLSGYYVSATGFMLFFHLLRAIDCLSLISHKNIKLLLLVNLFVYFSFNILYFDYLSIGSLGYFWQQHLFIITLLLLALIWLFLCYQKNCISCYLYLLALMSLVAIYYYLYPFRTITYESALSAATSPLAMKIIVIASIISLPGIALTMVIINRFFGYASKKNYFDY